MPLLRVNATATGLKLHDTSQQNRCTLWEFSARPGPAIIMLHGYKYAPASAGHCPHQKIFNPGPTAWPAKLGFVYNDKTEGLGIALGWYARGSLKDVHRRARALATQLASIVDMLRDQSPQRPVHVLAHSLGVELALSTLPHLPAGSIDRMVLLTGAAYQSRARETLATDAGRSAEVLNIVSRENDLFDAAFERLVPACSVGDCAIGNGIDARNVVNLQIDCTRSIAALNRLSFDISPKSKRISHWSAYRRQGVMALYSTFLRQPQALPLSILSRLLPRHGTPRWSRLVPELQGKDTPRLVNLHKRLGDLASANSLFATAFAGRTQSEQAN